MSAQSRSAPSRLQARIVWGAWAVLSVAVLFLVARCSRNVPFWDDWKLVWVLLGGQPLSPAWLWEQCNEHRLPLSKALMWTLATLSGGDLRWAMFGSALLLCALPLLLLLTLRRLAGPLRWTDLVLPVALLNWGHQYNLLFQMQLHFLLAVTLFVGALMLLLRWVEPGRTAPSRTWALCALTLPLPWISGVGLCLSPVLVLWMLWAAPLVPQPSQRRALRLCALLMSVGVAVLLSHMPSSPTANKGFMGVGATAATALRCLATALGPVGRELSPWSGLFVALFGLASGLLLLRVMWREPERRLGASVLLAGLLATAGLALLIGISRAGLGWEAGLAPRYTTTMAPGLCCAYLAWRRYGTGWPGRGVPALLCFALCLALPFNSSLGLQQAQQHAAVLGAFEADVRADRPPAELVRVHGSEVCPSETRLAGALQLLRARKLWLYR